MQPTENVNITTILSLHTIFTEMLEIFKTYRPKQQWCLIGNIHMFSNNNLWVIHVSRILHNCNY